MIPHVGNNAAAGALIKAPSWIQVILAPIGSFWGYVAQLSASCGVGRVASAANPADAQSRNKPSFTKPEVEGELASMSGVPKPRRILRVAGRLTGEIV